MTIINQKSISGITSITFASAGDDLLTFHSNNGTERFRIDNSGNTKITAGIVTTLTVTGTTTLNGNLDLQDDDKILIGTGDDLEFYHDGTHSHIVSNTGNLRILADGSGSLVLTSKAGEEAITCAQDGAVTIKHDNSTKFTTKSDGIDVTGEVQCDSVDVDGGHINLESGYSLQWSDSHERIEQSDGKIEFFTNNGQQMTLSGGNLGIGVESPTTSLHIQGANTLGKGQLLVSSASAGQEARMTFIDGSDDIAEISTDGDNLYFYNEISSGAFQFYTGGSERIRILSSGGLTFNGDTATANALDDYEEGFFTPTLVGANGGAASAYSRQNGGYVKVGNVVHVYGYLKLSSKGSSISGALKVGGFPFTTKNDANYFQAPGIGWYTGFSGVTVYSLGFDAAPNTTSFTLARGSGTSVTSVALSQITDTFGVEWAFTYRTE